MIRHMTKRYAQGSLFTLFIVVLCVYSFAPAIWLLLTSLKTTREILHVPIAYLPHPIVFTQYADVFGQAPFLRFIINSVIVSLSSTLLCIAVATLAAYPIARLNIKGKNALLVGFVLISTFPLISMMVPLFQVFRDLHLLNHLITLILPYSIFSLPISILTLTAFFREIPADLEDAARIDGCGRIGALVRVIFPLSAPGVATAAMLAFVNGWNEFTLAFSLISNPDKYTLPVGITLLRGQYTLPWGMMSAGISIAILPLVVLIVVFQKSLISGLTRGAIKG
jgi:trehalose/maltose transport system permease protein